MHFFVRGWVVLYCAFQTGLFNCRSQVFPLFSSYAMAVMCMDITEVKTNMYQMNIYTSKKNIHPYSPKSLLQNNTEIFMKKYYYM